MELQFIKEAECNGLVQLKGHSSNPGIRVSMYNAMEVAGIYKLIQFMQYFQEKNDDQFQYSTADESTSSYRACSLTSYTNESPFKKAELSPK